MSFVFDHWQPHSASGCPRSLAASQFQWVSSTTGSLTVPVAVLDYCLAVPVAVLDHSPTVPVVVLDYCLTVPVAILDHYLTVSVGVLDHCPTDPVAVLDHCPTVHSGTVPTIRASRMYLSLDLLQRQISSLFLSEIYVSLRKKKKRYIAFAMFLVSNNK